MVKAQLKLNKKKLEAHLNPPVKKGKIKNNKFYIKSHIKVTWGSELCMCQVPHSWEHHIISTNA